MGFRRQIYVHLLISLLITTFILQLLFLRSITNEDYDYHQILDAYQSNSNISTPIKSPILPKERRDRFPSVDERVKLYMGRWYDSSCTKAKIRYRYTGASEKQLSLEIAPQTTIMVKNQYLIDEIFFYDQDSFENCTLGFCRDVIQSISLEKQSNPPILLQFGDQATSTKYGSPALPILKKFRTSWSLIEREKAFQCNLPTTEPIIWKLESDRHYDSIEKLRDYDVPWDQKINKAIFWGAPTGRSNSLSPIPTEKAEACLSVPRCKLVVDYANSDLVVAKLVRTRDRFPEIVHGINVTGGRMSMQEIVKHKALIMLEGNDVSSGLKWALRSNSVVMTQTPTKTSWAMEELLQPWTHYIPLANDLSDVEEKMKWVIENDETARQIARRGTLWMLDLLEHPLATKENELVNNQILERYRGHFAGSASKTDTEDHAGEVKDYSHLLHYAIIGHPKTATSFLASWLASHPNIQADADEMYYLQNQDLESFVQYLEHLPSGLRGYKAPRDVVQLHSLNYLGKHFPSTKLIVGVRHPVRWFESYYNYRARNNVTLPPPETLGDECHKSRGVCGFEARFHVHLAQMGKTKPSDPTEKKLLRTQVNVSNVMSNPVFLYDQAQLEDSDETRRLLFREDLMDFLELDTPLSPLPPTHLSENTKEPLDICEERYMELRWKLMRISEAASEWIRHFFMHQSDVTISSIDHFEEILKGWLVDPCKSQDR